MTYEAGEIVVGWEKPVKILYQQPHAQIRSSGIASWKRTLGNLLSSINLGHFLLQNLVTLLAYLDNLCAGNAELGDLGENLFGNLTGGLVLGQGIGVIEGVVWTVSSL